MVKNEIVEGLKYAVAKGEKLQNAMMSFFGAGYSKKDIEEAAQVLQAPKLPQTQFQQPIQQPIQQPAQQIQQTTKPLQTQFQQPDQQPDQQPIQQPIPIVTQRVSAYGEKPKSGGKTLMMVLVFFLILLLGILIAVFLFRDQLAAFLENLF